MIFFNCKENMTECSAELRLLQFSVEYFLLRCRQCIFLAKYYRLWYFSYTDYQLCFTLILMMFSSILSDNAIYAIPTGDLAGKADDALQLIYSPLTGLSLMADVADMEDISGRLEKVILGSAGPEEELASLYAPQKLQNLSARMTRPEQIRRLCILANQRCNFACSYCYSARGRDKTELNEKQMMAAFEWLISLQRPADTQLTVAFIGGGEPLLSWGTIRRCIENMARIAEEKHLKLGFLLITNGSLLTEDTILFMTRYRVNLQVSFEVLPDVQNAQRGHYERVHANLLKAQEAGLPFALRSVITQLNLARMSEMAQLTLQNYPSVKYLRLEPVVDSAYLCTPDAAHRYYDQFYEGFTRACEEAAPHGLNIMCTDYGNVDMLRLHYCGPQAVLTPKGLISSCEFESDEQDGRFRDYLYGELSGDGVAVSDAAFERVYPSGGSGQAAKCRTCWARWNCGGGCRYRREQLGEAVFDEYCRFTRRLLRYTLVERLRRNCIQQGYPDPLA